MPRAFDRGVPPVDKNPLISATSWGDPGTIIGEAAATAGVQIQQFLFDWVYSLFEDCVAFLEDLKLLGEGDNPLAQLGTGLQSVIDQLFDIFFCGNTVDLTPTALISGLQNFLEPIQNNAFVQGLVAFAEFLGRETGVFLRDVFEGLLGLVDWICGIFTCNPNNSGSTPQTIVDGLSAFIDPLINNVTAALGGQTGVAVGNVALDIFNGVLGMVEALCSLVTTGALPETYGSWANTPAQIVDDIAAIVGQLLDNPIVNGLRDLIAGTGNVLYDTISGLLVFINDLVGLLGQVMSGPQAIIDFLSGLLGADGLDGWVDSLPFIGPLVSKLTGFDSSGDLALDLAQLGTWAQGLLTSSSSIPAAQLIGSIPAAVLGSVPVSSINFTAGNLLSQGSFANANTVEAGGGWAWDGTTTAPGTTGGSVKATATGSLQQLYSRQTIKVAAGDRVDVSALVKTSGFSSGSMVLSVVPWIGTSAQTAHVVHTRTSSAASFTAMTGSRLRIGGTAEAGEVALSGSITALTVRLAVTANSGAQIWFDNVEVKKAGALAQTLVEYLTTTWEQAWNAVFGSGGSGKIWSDFITTVTTVFDRANLGVTNAGTAQGTAVGIIDGVGQAIFGDAAYNALPRDTKTSIRKLVGTLFGIANPVLDEILAAAVPDLDGSIITTGTIGTDVLPTDELLPSAGSGAILTRTLPNPVGATTGRNQIATGFYNTLEVAPSADIQVMTSGSSYTGAFRALTKGWYSITMGFGGRQIASSGWSLAPLLYKGSSLASLAPYKVGAEVWATTGAWTRYAHGSFTVFLNAGDYVRAGYDVVYGPGTNPLDAVIDADTTGVENYFAIALLSKVV